MAVGLKRQALAEYARQRLAALGSAPISASCAPMFIEEPRAAQAAAASVDGTGLGTV